LKIKDILDNRQSFSVELFPPKKTDSFDNIINTLDNLNGLDIDFVSVTYGAGGSSRDNTVKLSKKIKNEYNLEVITHLTCINSKKDEIASLLDEMKENNLENILALRGDIPSEVIYDDYKYASDLIPEIKSLGDFCVGAACYPEKHPEAPSNVYDIKKLKQKTALGCDFLISQLFLDNTMFFNFQERLELADVNTKVLAGIMPVINKAQFERIIQLSGCNVPPKFKKILEKYEHNPSALKDAGIAYAIDQIIDLMCHDVDGIHLYIMNKPENAKRILDNITGLRNA